MSYTDASYRKTNKAFFLDRDDTLIKDFGYLDDPDKVELLEGVVDALKEIRHQGYKLLVITNQSGLTRGSVAVENLELIHQKISDLFALEGVRIDGYYSAPYQHGHPRRKPGAGLLEEAATDWGIDFSRSWMAGDKWRDLYAGWTKGCRTLLVNEAPEQRALFQNFQPDLILQDWSEFVSLPTS